MLSHEAKQIYVKSDGDGILQVLMRCCGDSSTDSWHTIYVQGDITDEQIQAWVAQAKATCQNQHSARERARAIISGGLST